METRHIVIDMQRMFAEQTPWHAPAVNEILPNVLTLCEVFAGRNLFAKFMLPESPRDARDAWQAYYGKWSAMTTECIAPQMQDLVTPLHTMATPESIIHKTTYSVCQSKGFIERLKSEGVQRLVFSGVETDICVLASVFDAVDAGFHVVVVSDATGSSSTEAHNATLKGILPRMAEQIELLETADLVAASGRSR